MGFSWGCYDPAASLWSSQSMEPAPGLDLAPRSWLMMPSQPPVLACKVGVYDIHFWVPARVPSKGLYLGQVLTEGNAKGLSQLWWPVGKVD